MDKEELIKYEMPIIAEFISIGWLQTLLAWYIGNKVNRKLRRYSKRLAREAFLRHKNIIS